MKDANDQLQKETGQRVTRMVAIVQAAAEEMAIELERIEKTTGQDHSDLFKHPDFLEQVAKSLLLGGWPDLDRLQPEFQRMFGERATELEEPLLSFYQNLDTLIVQDDLWGETVRQFRLEARVKRLDGHALQIHEAALQAVASINELPGRIVATAEARRRERLEALERSYLRGLYAECNDLPLAGDAPPDARLQRRPRLQKVYVDLDTDEQPDWERIMNRLGVEQAMRDLVRSTLEGINAQELRPLRLHVTLEDKQQGQATTPGRDELLAGNREAREALEKLGIQQKALDDVIKPVSTLEAIHDHPQLVLLGDPGSGKSTLTRRLAGMLAAAAVDGLPADEADWRANLTDVFDRWLLPVRIVLSRWATHLPDSAEGNAGDLITECRRLLAQTVGETGAERLEALFLERLNAAQPTVLLLLDGLDEVADEEQRKVLLAAVRDFCASYGAVRLIVTCRVRPIARASTSTCRCQKWRWRR